MEIHIYVYAYTPITCLFFKPGFHKPGFHNIHIGTIPRFFTGKKMDIMDNSLYVTDINLNVELLVQFIAIMEILVFQMLHIIVLSSSNQC